MEVPQDQGYYEHARLRQDQVIERGKSLSRAVVTWRVFWLAAGVVLAALLIGFFLWIWLVPR